MLLIDKQLKMNDLFTMNNVLVFNVFWCGLWTVQFWGDFLKMHSFNFGQGDRTPIDTQGWRAASSFAFGYFVLCIWALRLPFESKRSFVQSLIAPYFAAFLWLLNDKDVYVPVAWNGLIIALSIGTVLTFAGGFVFSPERIVPLRKSVVPESGVEPSKVHAA